MRVGAEVSTAIADEVNLVSVLPLVGDYCGK